MASKGQGGPLGVGTRGEVPSSKGGRRGGLSERGTGGLGAGGGKGGRNMSLVPEGVSEQEEGADRPKEKSKVPHDGLRRPKPTQWATDFFYGFGPSFCYLVRRNPRMSLRS